MWFLELNGDAVVKDLVTTALLQLTLEHQSAVHIQANVSRANVQILSEKHAHSNRSSNVSVTNEQTHLGINITSP